MSKFNFLPIPSFMIPQPLWEGEDGGAGGGDKGQQQNNNNLIDKDGGGQHRDAPPEKPWYDGIAEITGDESLLTEAKRYKASNEVLKSLVETKKMVRSAPKDDPMPDIGDGKDEAKLTALKGWRERHGIPAEETGYKINEDVTKRLLEADKPLIENFTKTAFAKNQPQSVVDFATAWYVDAMEQQAQQEAANDTKDSQAAEDTLRADWAGNYRTNFDFAVKTAVQLLGDKYDGMSIFNARLDNGMRLGSIPEFVKGMHQVGLAIFGDGSLVGGEAVKAQEGRKAELRQIMKTNINEYYEKGLDKEYEAIVAAEEKAANAPGRR